MQKVKVYRTVVRQDHLVSETFVTTSREIHLSLGQLSEDGLWNLSLLIHAHLGDGKNGKDCLLIKVCDEDREGMLATVVHTDRLCIHLSRAMK